MMLAYSGIKFHNETWLIPENIDYSKSAWFISKKPELMKKNPLINLPYVVDGEVVVTQSNACLSYLGRKLGYWGMNETEITLCEQLLCEIYDLRNDVVRWSYPMNKPVKEYLEGVKSNGSLTKLEAYLAANSFVSKDVNTPFLVGDHITAPDFHLWELLDQFSLMAKFFQEEKAFLDDSRLPNIAAFYERFKALPRLQGYLQSKMATSIGCNNLSAKFGSLPSGAQYIPGAGPLPEDCSGVYQF